MRPAIEVAVRLSEVRERLNELGGKSELTTEERSEVDTLTAEYRELETRARALAIAQDAEERAEAEKAREPEFRTLVNEASIGEVFAASVENRATEGATRELQDELGLTGNQVPLALIEERAVTPAPADVGTSQAAILRPVFPQAIAAYLGVRSPRVPTGEAGFPVFVTGASASTPDKGGAVSESTGAFVSYVLEPARIQAAFHMGREDRARFRGMGSALRENLRMALADKLDEQIIHGPKGLLGTDAQSPANPTDPTTEADFAAYRGLIFDAAVIDGLYAYTAGDIRMAVGPATYAHAAGKYRTANSDEDALASLMRASGGVRASKHIPDPASGVQSVLMAKGQGRRNMVAALWEGVTIITDEVTRAAEGEFVFTAVMLYAVKVLRAAGFSRKEVKLTA